MDRECLEKSYKIAIEARNFHYDNFNKWMTFFYVAIGAILVAFYQVANSSPGGGDGEYLKITLLLLGFIISVFWHLACKGYYFWMKNWIRIIIKIEKELENDKDQRLYSIFCKEIFEKDNNLFCPIQSANISTSKITLSFSFIVCIAWAFILLFPLIASCHPCAYLWFIVLVLAVVMSLTFIYIIGVFHKSDLNFHDFVQCSKDEK